MMEAGGVLALPLERMGQDVAATMGEHALSARVRYLRGATWAMWPMVIRGLDLHVEDGCQGRWTVHDGSVHAVSQQTRLMNLSLVVAVILLVAKVVAAVLTGSSAIYSDAAESVVHVLVVCFGSYALRMARKPADDSHHYGHDKLNYLSSGFEAVMISVAALLIFYQAIVQMIEGVNIEHLGVGVVLTGTAAVINLLLGLALVNAGKRHQSPLLKANGLHVLTDVWSSGAVLFALLLYGLTDWVWWDPIAAILAAGNILLTGYRLFRESMGGLLDEANPEMEQRIRDLLDQETAQRELSYHNLRYRYSGMIHWVEMHLVVDDSHTIRSAHQVATEIESSLASILKPQGRVITHLEPKSAEHEEESWETR